MGFFFHKLFVWFDEIKTLPKNLFTGVDWEWGDQDGGQGSVGVVYRVNDSAIVHVRELFVI